MDSLRAADEPSTTQTPRPSQAAECLLAVAEHKWNKVGKKEEEEERRFGGKRERWEILLDLDENTWLLGI